MGSLAKLIIFIGFLWVIVFLVSLLGGLVVIFLRVFVILFIPASVIWLLVKIFKRKVT